MKSRTRAGLEFGAVLGISLAALQSSFAQQSQPTEPPSYRMRVSNIGNLAQVVAELRRDGFDIPYVDRKQGVIDVVGTPRQQKQLEQRGLWVEPIIEPTASRDQTEALSDYLSPAEIAARLDAYQTSYPALAQRIPYATDHLGGVAYAMRISDNVTVEEAEPVILFVAQHHAREVMTPEVAVDIIDQLLTRYGIDSEITRWIDNYEIWVIPNHNPDGANFVFTGDSNWRKNRRDNGDGSIGVDPNRNYPYRWGNSVCAGSSSSPSSDTYHGPGPASEPITAGLVELARTHRPAIAVSFHTYSELAIHPFGCTGDYPNHPDFQFVREMANEVSTRITGDQPNTWYQFGTGPELLYEVDGEMSDWFYAELGSVGVTFEFNTSTQGFQPDYATWRDSTVTRARAGWRYFFELLERSRLGGQVRDACSAAPIPAGVNLQEITFTHGETPRAAESGHGLYNWFVRPGSYTLEVSHSGYRAQVWPTTLQFDPVVRDLWLVPSGSQAVAVSRIELSDPTGDGDGEADPGETLEVALESYATGDAVSGVLATLTSSDPYVTVLQGNVNVGAISAGDRTTTSGLQVRIAPEAPDQHLATLSVAYSAAGSLCAAANTAAVRVTRGYAACPFLIESLDVNPGWQIENSTTGGWAYGSPASGAAGGPNSAYTGSAVYGTNLTGSYADNADYKLTAGPYDLSSLRRTELRFARWLQAEPGFDIARVQLRLGVSGVWQTVWEGFGRDTQWIPIRLDVSSIADQESEVYVRFTLQSDSNTVSGGFYLDDLSFCGEEVPGVGGKVKFKAYQIDDSNLAYANGNGALDLGETATLQIDLINSTTSTATLLSAVLSATSPGVTVFDQVASYPDLVPSAVARSQAPHFTIQTSSSCGSSIAFELDTRWNDGQRATSSFTVPVGTTGTVFPIDHDMESNQGWVPGSTAVAGAFVRQNPNGVTDPVAGPVQPEDDTTAAPGVTCWVTANPPVGPGFDPKSGDVDRGVVWLESPTFDGTGDGPLTAGWKRWLHRSNVTGLNTARYRARLSNNGGASWTDLESIELNASVWSDVQFDISSILPRTTNMKLRFEAEESIRSPGDPVLELLIDDVRIAKTSIVCAPFTPTETRTPNPVGGTLLVTRVGGDVKLSWTAPGSDATHDPARFYPIYRSAAPTTGFASIGEATVPSYRDPDQGVAAVGSRFYLVSAKNAAGTSGEEPTP